MLLSGICDSLVVPCWTTISSWCNKNLREKQGPIRLRCLPISARETACTLLRAAILFVLAFGMSLFARVIGDGPPSLFWPTNGIIIMFLTSSPSMMDFLLATVAGMFGLAMAQFGDVRRSVAFQLAGANAVEFVLASIIMRLIRHGDVPISEAVKTFRFLAELIFIAGVLASSIGATAGAYIITSEFPGSVYNDQWTDWFVGDLTGNFIVLYIGYLCIANSRKEKLEVIRETLKTGMGILYLGVIAMACGMVITIYSLEDVPLIKAVPLMLLASPILGNMALCFPQEVSAAVDLVLVLSVVLGTKLGRGPLTTVLEGACPSSPSQRTISICIEVTLLISTTLTATLAVTREQRVAQALRMKTANDDRVAFFSHVSHEFRTPLSVIIGFTEDLLKHLDLPRQAYSDLESVLNASIALASMVEDLLAFFSLERNKLTVAPKLVKSQEFFGGFFSFSTRLASTKKIRLEMEGRVPAKLVFDPDRVNQVLVNLVANAIKFTQAEGRVVVSAKVVSRAESEATRSLSKAQEHVGGAGLESRLMRLEIVNPRQSCGSFNHPGDGPVERSSDVDRGQPDEQNALIGEKKNDPGFAQGSTVREIEENEGGGDVGPDSMLVLSVRDTGIGIKSEDIPRLLDRFFRCKNSGAHGTGLGLSIAFNITKAMNGTLAISSEFGVGSTFTITFPLEGEEGVSSEAQPGREAAVVKQSKNRRRFSFERKRGLRPDGGASGAAETEGAKSTKRSDDVVDSFMREAAPLPPPLSRNLSIFRSTVLRLARGLDTTSSRAQPEATTREKPASLLIEKQRQGPPQAQGRQLRSPPKNRREVVDLGKSRRSERNHESNIGEIEDSGKQDDVAHETASNGTPEEGGKKDIGVEGSPAQVLPSRKLQDLHGGEEDDDNEVLQVHILLAEDSLPNQKLMVRILQRVGHTVETVEDGQAAIDLISTGRFDLLVLDLGLPIKSGMDVLRELRSHRRENIRNTPAIISSGHVLDSHRKACADSGCNAFTEKPFRANIILETVQTVLRSHLRDVTSREATVEDPGTPSGVYR